MAVAIGEALYPALFEPKVDKYTPTPGVYSIDLKVTDEERDRLIASGINQNKKMLMCLCLNVSLSQLRATTCLHLQ